MFAVFLLVAAACLCKESAFLVAPIVALAAGLGARAATGRFTIRPLVSVLAAAAAVAILRVRALGGLGLQPQQGAQLDLGAQVARLGEQLSFAHGFDPRAVMTVAPAGPARWWMLVLVVVTLACVAGAAARWGRRGAWLPAGLLCAALLALLPVIRLRWPALRYWYLPALCLAPLGGLALTPVLALARPRTVLIPVLALLVSWAAFGQLRMPAWRSDARLFAAEAALQPENPDALFFHAERTALDGRPDLAVPIFEDALARAPGHRPSWLGLGRALLSLGRPDAAETVARQSLMGEPRTWPQFMLLGDALARQEKWKDAQGAYDEALAKAPLIPDVLMAAAWAARRTGELGTGADPRPPRAGHRPRQSTCTGVARASLRRRTDGQVRADANIALRAGTELRRLRARPTRSSPTGRECGSPCRLQAGSSVVEQAPYTRRVAGSIPVSPTNTTFRGTSEEVQGRR